VCVCERERQTDRERQRERLDVPVAKKVVLAAGCDAEVPPLSSMQVFSLLLHVVPRVAIAIT